MSGLFSQDAEFWEVSWKFEGEQFETLLSLVEQQSFAAQQDVFKQGDPADGMYLVVEGFALAIRTDENGKERTIGIVSKGQSFGELGLLTNQPRSGTVAAGTALKTLKITPKQLDTLESDYPEIASALYKQLASSMAEQLANLTAKSDTSAEEVQS